MSNVKCPIDRVLSGCTTLSPILTLPPIMPIVARITPVGCTCRSTDFAVSKLTGYGMPWVMIVVSNATKGWWSTRACLTSGWRSMGNPLSSTEIKQVGRFLTEYDNARKIGRSINQSGENKRVIWCNSLHALSIVGMCILYIIWITSLFSTPSLWPHPLQH